MAIHRAERAIDIAAPPELCFDTIVDYDTFTEWQEPVLSTEVLERYEDGLGKIVELRVDGKFREVRYRLHYHYERPRRIWWDFLEADGVEHIEGEYRFDPADGGTRATYRVGIDPGVPVPGFVARMLNESLMKQSMRELKAEAEARAAA